MNTITPIIGNDANVAGGTVSPKLNAGAVRNPPICRECLGTGKLSGYFTNDPGEKMRHWECTRCNGDGWEPEWKPSEDMRDVGADAYYDTCDMDVQAEHYVEAILIACRPLIIAEYEESKK